MSKIWVHFRENYKNTKATEKIWNKEEISEFFNAKSLKNLLNYASPDLGGMQFNIEFGG